MDSSCLFLTFTMIIIRSMELMIIQLFTERRNETVA